MKNKIFRFQIQGVDDCIISNKEEWIEIYGTIQNLLEERKNHPFRRNIEILIRHHD